MYIFHDKKIIFTKNNGDEKKMGKKYIMIFLIICVFISVNSVNAATINISNSTNNNDINDFFNGLISIGGNFINDGDIIVFQ